MSTCGSCNKTFPSGPRARDNHCGATGHAFLYNCQTCNVEFKSSYDCDVHMSDRSHWRNGASYECPIYGCPDVFRNKANLTRHETHEHAFCHDCNRMFKNYNNLREHLGSRIHQTGVKCPLCKTRSFASVVGLAHHIERGACSAGVGIDRIFLYQLAMEKDPHRRVTKDISWADATKQLTCDKEQAWNGHSFKCRLCPRTFSQVRGLTQHLSSPTHHTALYICPDKNCDGEFKTYASLLNHLQSQKCKYLPFKKLQDKVHVLLDLNHPFKF